MKTSVISKRLALIILLMAGALFSLPAQADENSTSVSIRGLDLRNPLHAKILLDDILKTSEQICKGNYPGSGLRVFLDKGDCIKGNYEKTIARINNKYDVDIEAVAAKVEQQHLLVHSTVVKFYDLDLTNPSDARTLLSRIHTAAKNACGRLSIRPIEIHNNKDADRCVTTSFRDTVARVNSRFNTNIEKVAGMTGEQHGLVSKR